MNGANIALYKVIWTPVTCAKEYRNVARLISAHHCTRTIIQRAYFYCRASAVASEEDNSRGGGGGR